MILREILHAHIPTLTEASTFRDAVDKMDIYQFPGLVVVDRSQKPIGVLTEGDLVRELGDGRPLQDRAADSALSIATRDPIVAPPSMDIESALRLMIEQDLTLLPIVEGDVLLGIVLRVDLMQAILMGAASSLGAS